MSGPDVKYPGNPSIRLKGCVLFLRRKVKMPDRKRDPDRVQLIYYLRISDIDSGKNVGHLVDITPQGIMMLSEEEIPADRDFSFRIQLPSVINGLEEIDFTARCLWCRNDYNPAFYLSGYRIENISSPEKEAIRKLIHSYGFKRVQNK